MSTENWLQDFINKTSGGKYLNLSLTPYGKKLLTSSAMRWMLFMSINSILLSAFEAILTYFTLTIYYELNLPTWLITSIAVFIGLTIWLMNSSFITLDLAQIKREQRKKYENNSLFRLLPIALTLTIISRLLLVFIGLLITTPILTDIIHHNEIRASIPRYNYARIALLNEENKKTVSEKYHKKTIQLQDEISYLNSRLQAEVHSSNNAGYGIKAKMLSGDITDKKYQLITLQKQYNAELNEYNEFIESNQHTQNGLILIAARFKVDLLTDAPSDLRHARRLFVSQLKYKIGDFPFEDAAIITLASMVFIAMILTKLMEPKSVSIYYDEQLQANYADYLRGYFDNEPCLEKTRKSTAGRPMDALTFNEWYYNIFKKVELVENELRFNFSKKATDSTQIKTTTQILLTPVTLQTLELQDVRRFQHIKFDFPSPVSTTEGQWVVILGPNGAGKTTLLRGIAIALRNIKDPNIWPANSFDGWARLGQSEQRTSEAHILVTVNGKQHETTIRSNGNQQYYQDPPQTRPHLLPLFAYGCRRGSALGGASTMVKLGDAGGPEIATLFDEGADLIHAETWLKELDGDAARNERSAHIFAAASAALQKLLGIQSLEVRDKIVWITDHNAVRMPLRYLSDGYLTTAGWFLDLIARWIDLCERHKVTINADFMQHMRGLVLIDEIDLHLHPRFQIEIIARTRDLLPQMSFVVTTHNPLTLIGAKAHEIWMISDENGQPKVQQGVETPALLTGSELYLSYFGINDYFPGELGQAYQRYAVLCNDIMRSDDEDAELYRLQAQLKAANMLPPFAIAQRYAHTTAPTHEPTRTGAPTSASTPASAPPQTQADTPASAPKKRSRKKAEPDK